VKAQLLAASADWPTYLALVAQAAAVGGALLFAIPTMWVFGREFSDRTAKELLALPTPRAAIVAAKFTTVAIWLGLLTVWLVLLGLVLGALIRLPGGSSPVLLRGIASIAASALLTIALTSWVALFASVGRGYLGAVGWTVLAVFLAQIVAAAGWGAWFPWSVPALGSGLAGPASEPLGAVSYLIVLLAAVAAALATFSWWTSADQSR
jgi:ABC-2 type transport system permease protein